MAARHVIFFLLASLGAYWQSPLHAQQSAIAITNVTVIDATGSPAQSGVTVVIEKERITAIGSAVEVPIDAAILDGTGKFLIPGLRDMHIHLGSYEDAKKALGKLVASGITGVRDMASPVEDVVRLREEVMDVGLIGPTLDVAGPILQGPLPFQAPPMIRTVANPDETRLIVDELVAAKVDFIKVGDTVGRDSYLAVVEQASLRGLRVAGHLPVSVSAEEASLAGQHSIEHFGSARFHGLLISCSEDEAALRDIAQQALETARAGGASPDLILLRAAFITRLLQSYSPAKARALFLEFVSNYTWQTPTLVAIRDVWNGQASQLNPDDVVAADLLWQKYAELIRAMQSAGVKILAGTDIPITNQGSPLHEELALLVEAGLSPLEAIQSATRNAADYLGTLETEGTIELGKVADLVLLNADPLDDIANTKSVYAVFLRGRLISNSQLQQLQ